MIRHLVELPDGSQWFSGTPGETAIQSVKLTRYVNTGTEPEPGAVCAAMLELTLLTAEAITVEPGMEVTLYRVDPDGNREQEGIFVLETPVRAGSNRYNLTAYDRVSRLDRDLSQWLSGLAAWPYPLKDFARMVCQACGVTLRTEELPNGSLPVPAFAAQGITGRQLMQWIGQLSCRFCTAAPDGTLTLGWYRDGGRLSPSDCLGGSLQYADYTVTPVDQVQLRLTEDAVGALHPDTGEGENACVITGNYLLSGMEQGDMQAAAQEIYNQLRLLQYTPCKVTIPADMPMQAGMLVKVTLTNGSTITTCVMKSVRSGQGCQLESTGSVHRNSPTAVNSERYQRVNGKLMELRKSIEGLEMEVSQTVTQTEGALRQEIFNQNTAVISDCKQILLSALDSYVLTEEVESLRQTVESQFSLMADQISMNFTTVMERTEEVNGQLQSQLTQLQKYFRFSAEGLVIGSGENQVELQLDNSGIVFRKDGVRFGYWDGDYFHTGNLVVTANETARLGEFTFTSGSDGSLSFSKAGD